MRNRVSRQDLARPGDLPEANARAGKSRGEEAAGLAVDQRGVVAVLGHQLSVVAVLDDAALFEDQDAIGVDDRGEPVGDDERGPALDQPFESLLYQEFRLG